MTIACRKVFSDHHLRIIYYCFCAMLHVLLFICGCVRLLPVEYSLRTVPTNSKVCLRGLLNMREKKILASVIGIQKQNGSNHAFFEDN